MLVIFLILIEFSINISKLSDKNKILAQELALLKNELEELSNKENLSQGQNIPSIDSEVNQP